VLGVVLGAAVMVINDILVVMLTDSCESNKRTKASTRKIGILDHMELRNSSVLSDVICRAICRAINGPRNYEMGGHCSQEDSNW
jgi:hypothetical protein